MILIGSARWLRYNLLQILSSSRRTRFNECQKQLSKTAIWIHSTVILPIPFYVMHSKIYCACNRDQILLYDHLYDVVQNALKNCRIVYLFRPLTREDCLSCVLHRPAFSRVGSIPTHFSSTMPIDGHGAIIASSQKNLLPWRFHCSTASERKPLHGLRTNRSRLQAIDKNMYSSTTRPNAISKQ